MPPRKTQPAEWLDLVARNAERLRKAGVTKLELDGCKVELSPYVSEEIVKRALEQEDEPNVWGDPATFGLRDGRVPGFSKLHED
jgi:hypothetical protein